MTLPLIIYRSLRQHALSTAITVAGIALASGLLLCVWMVRKESQAAFVGTATSFDAVLGARGSKLQLVLNAVFHVEASPGNLEWSDFQAIRKHPLVKAALPLAVGDNYRGYRLAGTLPEVLQTIDYANGKRLTLQPGGRWIASVEAKEALVGSFAAQKLGLKVGDRFHPYHGLAFNPANQHEDEYVVTGLLEPTNTPADRVIWIPIEGLQTMKGHDAQSVDELSAVLIQLRTPAAGFMLDRMYNRQGNRLTFAYPVGTIIAELFGKIAWFDRVLTLVGYLVALVAAGSVLASIYNSMSARRRDLAILRALGARRRLIFSSVVLEAGCIGVLGSLLGYVVYLALAFGVAFVIRRETGVVLDVWARDNVLWIGPAAMVLLCAAGGVIPAIKAYNVPVAETLAPLS